MFPKNAWYVACTPNEIDEKPLGRTICGERIAFYRGEASKVAAVEDFCPHRGAPLSLGYVQEGKLVCGYHGLAMGCEGKTVSMPGQRVRGFPRSRASRSRSVMASSGSGPVTRPWRTPTTFLTWSGTTTRPGLLAAACFTSSATTG
jgi:phenylpropionate dioxygenase-like ring-hydroxylating dioxygenase large terminal subunit